MSERLEEIEEEYQWAIEQSLANRISDSDIEWLIKQAKRVQELEQEVNDWREEVKKWQKFYKESEESHLETKELLHSTISENQRYKQALEFYADKENYFLKQRMTSSFYTPIELDKGEKARQALEKN